MKKLYPFFLFISVALVSIISCKKADTIVQTPLQTSNPVITPDSSSYFIVTIDSTVTDTAFYYKNNPQDTIDSYGGVYAFVAYSPSTSVTRFYVNLNNGYFNPG